MIMITNLRALVFCIKYSLFKILFSSFLEKYVLSFLVTYITEK